MRPLLTRPQEKFRQARVPSGTLALDESIIAYAGRSRLVGRVMNKPVKSGMEVYMLCDSTSAIYSSMALPET